MSSTEDRDGGERPVMTDERLFEIKRTCAECFRTDDRVAPELLGEALDEIDRLRAERKPTGKSLDRMLAEAIEAETDWNSPSCRMLRAIAHEVLQERIANTGKLAPIPDRSVSEGGYLRIKHLMYELLMDSLTVRDLREAVDEACRAVELGGIIMGDGEGKIAAELALRIRGKEDDDG